MRQNRAWAEGVFPAAFIEGLSLAGAIRTGRPLDADQVQGFYFGRPVPAAEVSADILTDFRDKLPVIAGPEAEVRLVKSGTKA